MTADPLLAWRNEFPILANTTYMISHSLGAMPSSMTVPQRVLHGTEDDIVPFEFSRDFAQASKNATFVPIREAGHFELIDPRSHAWPAVLRNIKG
jgi:pimeloyl-ACP methyl ester carboxylesterase